MDKHLLVPYDGSPASRASVTYAVEEFPSAKFTLLYVMDPLAEYSRQRSFPGYTEDDEFKAEREKGEHLLEAALADLAEDITVKTELVVGNPADAIVEYADTNEIDHVVIGSHARTGVSRFLLGSTAETVVRRLAVPVTVIRPRA